MGIYAKYNDTLASLRIMEVKRNHYLTQYRKARLERIELKEIVKDLSQHIVELLEYSEADKDVAHVWANAEDAMYKARQKLNSTGDSVDG